MARSTATPSIAETDEPSGSDIAEATKPKAKALKRKTKDEAPVVEAGDESEAAEDPPRKSTRAKKTRGVFEDIEVDVNFEESKPHQTETRRLTRSRSKAPIEGSDSDASVKSVRSTRSTKSIRGAATKSKKKVKAQPVVEEEGEEEMATPVQPLKKSTRSTAAPKSTKGRKPAREESVESESSGLLPTSSPRLLKSARKSHKRIIESESEDWQSAQEDVAPTPRPSTTKKARGRPPKVAKIPKALPKSSPSLPSPTPTSNRSRVSGSYMSESEFHIPVRDDTSKAKEPPANTAVQSFHKKPSNRNLALGESCTQPPTSSGLLSIGSKENAEGRDTIIIDSSDDDGDARSFTAPPKSVASSSNPSRINSDPAMTPKPKFNLAKKRDSFIGVVLEPSLLMKQQSAKVRGKIAERSETDMDKVMVLDQPSRSAETDHDSPVARDKGKAKATTTPAKLKFLSSAKERKKAAIQSKASDSVMDVDDGDNHEMGDMQSIRDSAQPSTPRRDPHRRLFEDDSNPFASDPQVDSTDSPNPLLALDISYGRVPAEVIYALAEEEKDMTVEEWTKRDFEIQLEKLKEHGLRKILEFKERAAEVKRRIEGL